MKANLVLEWSPDAQRIIFINMELLTIGIFKTYRYSVEGSIILNNRSSYTYFGGGKDGKLTFFAQFRGEDIYAETNKITAPSLRKDLIQHGNTSFGAVLPQVTKYLNSIVQPVEVPIRSLSFKNDKEYYFI